MPTERIALPRWLSRVPERDRKRATIRFLLRAAALYATESGTVRELSILCGCSRNTLATVATRDEISPRLAREIERLAGRELFPRELLCPHVYDDAFAAR